MASFETVLYQTKGMGGASYRNRVATPSIPQAQIVGKYYYYLLAGSLRYS